MPERRPGRRRASLATRITSLVALVATAVGLVAGLVTLQALRDGLDAEMRAQLRAELEIARDADDLDAALARIQATAEHSAVRWAVVEPSGAVSGPAADALDTELRDELAAGGEVSTRRIIDLTPVVLEGEQVHGVGLVLVRADDVLRRATAVLLVSVLPVLLLGVLAAIGGGALLARRISRPLVDVAAGADRLARGERDVALPDAALPEVARVSEALAALDRALGASEGRQREFLLSISHEIRTPLTAIRGFGEALADEVLPPERAGEVIRSEAERLDAFVADLLELARLESDDFRLEPSEAAVEPLARSALRAWSGRAATAEVRLELAAEPSSGSAVLDVRRVRQVLDGLLENALRVTPSGAAVRIEVAGDAERVCFAVADEGPGFSDTDLDVAFERGVIRERYAHARPVGTGLGLSIAQRLVGRMGGRITAQHAEGGGARFEVDLPRHQRTP